MTRRKREDTRTERRRRNKPKKETTIYLMNTFQCGAYLSSRMASYLYATSTFLSYLCTLPPNFFSFFDPRGCVSSSVEGTGRCFDLQCITETPKRKKKKHTHTDIYIYFLYIYLEGEEKEEKAKKKKNLKKVQKNVVKALSHGKVLRRTTPPLDGRPRWLFGSGPPQRRDGEIFISLLFNCPASDVCR